MDVLQKQPRTYIKLGELEAYINMGLIVDGVYAD
jgi:hypothetical protein